MLPLFICLLGLYLSDALSASKHQQLFLDTAAIAEWGNYLPMGIFYGVTTNPVLLERAGVPCNLQSLTKLARTALDTYNVECFMLQTWGESSESLVRNGLALQNIDPRLVVKVPLTKSGIEAAAILKSKGTRLCMTACYAPHQVFTSSALGAEYVAPYLGRMSDAGKDAIEEIAQMQSIVEGLQSGTRIFVASIRHVNQLATLSSMGLHTFTFSPSIAQGLAEDPLTIAAAADFERAANAK